MALRQFEHNTQTDESKSWPNRFHSSRSRSRSFKQFLSSGKLCAAHSKHMQRSGNYIALPPMRAQASRGRSICQRRRSTGTQRGCYLGEHPLLSAIFSLISGRVFSMLHHQHHARAISSTVRVPSLPCTALHYHRKPVLCQPTAHHYPDSKSLEEGI